MKKNNTKNIVVVVLTFNRLNILKGCLKSIQRLDYPVKKIVIVNNFSTDGTANFLSKYSSNKKISVFNRTINDGAAGGFNFGIKEALKHKPEAILLVDDELVLKKDSLTELINYFDSKTLLNSLILDYYHPKTIPFGLFDLKSGRGYNNLSEINSFKVVNCLNPWNATLVPSNVFKKIGLIDEKLFMSGEGDDFDHRAVLAGYKVITVCKSRAFMRKRGAHTKIIGNIGFISMPSPTAFYYTVRNTVVLRRRYKRLSNQFDKYSHFYKVFYFKLPNLIYYPSYFSFCLCGL